MEKPVRYRYDYSKCMVMKIGLSHPDPQDNTKSRVLLTFAQALAYIKAIDAITQGITKIYYLVGWQYLGHDDKYPDFFEVNQALKRPEDETAYDSFRWLCEQAKQYHSVVSVHINFNDAYDNAPSFPEFVEKGALIRKRNGKIHAIERYNGRKCYKTCHKTYWESGLFQRQFDRFVETFPFIAEAGTIHVDNFQCYQNYAPYVSIADMQQARRRMVEYVRQKGIDITSEFTYKETPYFPNRMPFGLPRDHFKWAKMDTVGEIPMSWWLYRMTRKEILAVPPHVYCGGEWRERRRNEYLYGNMHAEEILTPDNADWAADFIRRFATYQVPFHFLSDHRRLAIHGVGQNTRCVFSDDIVSYAKEQKITWHGEVLKTRNTVFLPLVQKENQWLAYSDTGNAQNRRVFAEGAKKADIYAITPQGNRYLRTVPVEDGRFYLSIAPGQALLVVFRAAED